MAYYSLQQSLEASIMAQYPPMKEVLDQGDIATNLVLPPKSSLTDLIYLWDVGFSFTLVLSGKLKHILEEHRQQGIQFTQCSVFQSGVVHTDYWLLNMTEISPDPTANFFLLKYPLQYVVSESLKNQIELADCQGIAFAPVELSLNEWLQDCVFSFNPQKRAVQG